MRILNLTSNEYILLLITSIFNAISLNFLTMAFQNEKSAFMASIGYILLVYALIIDIFYFKIAFDIYDISGALIIIVFNVLSIYFKIK